MIGNWKSFGLFRHLFFFFNCYFLNFISVFRFDGPLFDSDSCFFTMGLKFSFVWSFPFVFLRLRLNICDQKLFFLDWIKTTLFTIDHIFFSYNRTKVFLNNRFLLFNYKTLNRLATGFPLFHVTDLQNAPYFLPRISRTYSIRFQFHDSDRKGHHFFWWVTNSYK